MFIDAITYIEVDVVKNIWRIFAMAGNAIKFMKNLVTAPFSMYHF